MSEAFVERLAGRYRDIYKEKGVGEASKWFRTFVPREEQARVYNAVKEGRSR